MDEDETSGGNEAPARIRNELDTIEMSFTLPRIFNSEPLNVKRKLKINNYFMNISPSLPPRQPYSIELTRQGGRIYNRDLRSRLLAHGHAVGGGAVLQIKNYYIPYFTEIKPVVDRGCSCPPTVQLSDVCAAPSPFILVRMVRAAEPTAVRRPICCMTACACCKS